MDIHSLRDFLSENDSVVVLSGAARRRYRARSYAGWQNFSRARPNDAHHALAGLESSGKVDMLVTQNVDGPHRDAGSRSLIELHGAHAEVSRFMPDGDKVLSAIDRAAALEVSQDCVAVLPPALRLLSGQG